MSKYRGYVNAYNKEDAKESILQHFRSLYKFRAIAEDRVDFDDVDCYIDSTCVMTLKSAVKNLQYEYDFDEHEGMQLYYFEAGRMWEI